MQESCPSAARRIKTTIELLETAEVQVALEILHLAVFCDSSPGLGWSLELQCITSTSKRSHPAWLLKVVGFVLG